MKKKETRKHIPPYASLTFDEFWLAQDELWEMSTKESKRQKEEREKDNKKEEREKQKSKEEMNRISVRFETSFFV